MIEGEAIILKRTFGIEYRYILYIYMYTKTSILMQLVE